ncbi:MAG: anthranilate synthase component I family protein [Winogradskyella sp.]|nr:anthranilate synthase component I family protein [Winogradskyella sp.]
MRTTKSYSINNLPDFKEKLLCWAQQFDDFVWLDSNGHNDTYGGFEAILAVDALTAIKTDYNNAFEDLKEYQSQTNDWLFGYLTYDLKNDVEELNSKNYDGLEFPDLFFFQPKRIFIVKQDEVILKYLKMVDDEIEKDFEAIKGYGKSSSNNSTNDIKIKLRIHKDEYFEKINGLLEHIHRGDIYEANFCQEFYAEDTVIHPLETYLKLNAISKPPFATMLKTDDKYLLSASPERYLKKVGKKIISQPIKGTAKRSHIASEDAILKKDLANDQKERSENIMIVDLVRNDLSHTAKSGSVHVTELCKVHTFLQVHQMISTIESQLRDDVHPIDVIKTTFPMGSMTGAPKISAMKLIEHYEETKRGLYSGAVGYFTPEGDFDFNVIIRSILYNQSKAYVSYSVGSAVTSKSDPLKEYEECLIKAKAMREVLEN